MLATFLLLPVVTSITILPLGDSITAGCHGPSDLSRASYRIAIQDKLQAAGIPYDMVGNLTVNCQPVGYDWHHAGHGGYPVERIAEIAPSLIANHNPDIVLLLAGTNNHWDEPNQDLFYERYSQLLDLLGDRPVYAATVPRFGYDRTDLAYWTRAFVDERNNVRLPLMNRVIHELAAERDNVVVVQYFDALDPAVHLLPDGVHPNKAGQYLLADLFWNAAFGSDFNANGVLDVGDIDLLVGEIWAPAPRIEFDLNLDRSVDLRDHRMWVRQFKKTTYGDANLDRRFDSSDLIAAFVGGKFERDVVAGWRDGDWNGDRVFNSADFVLAFQDGRYEASPASLPSAIPEPAARLLAGIALLLVAPRWRRHSLSRRAGCRIRSARCFRA